MADANVSLVPLQHAVLCLDCETITAAHRNCIACGSTALLSIARALSGPVAEDTCYGDHVAIAARSARSTERDFIHST